MSAAHMVVIDGIRYDHAEAESRGLLADAEKRGAQVTDRPASDRARSPESATGPARDRVATDLAATASATDAGNPADGAPAAAVADDATAATASATDAGNPADGAPAVAVADDATATPAPAPKKPATNKKK